MHPHLHVLMTASGFRRDGTWVALPEPEAALLEALWQRAVLAELVRQGWPEAETAARMLAWPHSRFGAYVGPAIADREGQVGVVRYAARGGAGGVSAGRGGAAGAGGPVAGRDVQCRRHMGPGPRRCFH